MAEGSILQQAHSLKQELITHRRWLHSHAEVGFDLPQTREYVKSALKDMGYSPIECGKCGLVAAAGGKKPGKTFLLRADMDALPIREETGLDFACQNGSMHACGHDMHTAMLLGAAKLLKEREDSINGTVKLMFQGAEEIFEGAKDMIGNGVLKKPDVDAALMVHVAAGIPLPAGTIIVSTPGVSAPAADYFSIRVQGKGCHGSSPHLGIDPVIPAAQTILALENLRARELAPGDKSVLTIGTIHGGTAGNVIADLVEMQGTVRTYEEKTRAFLKTRMPQIAKNTAAAFRAEAEVEFGSGCPTLTNDRELSEFTENALSGLLGGSKVLSAAKLGSSQGGGSEDFAYVSQEIPSLMLALAAGEPDKGYHYPQHHPKVNFDEEALPYGCAALAYAAVKYLETH